MNTSVRPAAGSQAATKLPSQLRQSGLHNRTTSTSRATAMRRAFSVCASSSGSELPAALLFDCDGVLVDTERDGHRVSFNAAFEQKGLAHNWDVELYGELLKTGGGKERMTKYFSGCPEVEPFASLKTEDEQQSFIKDMHKLKTDLFMEMVEGGSLPLRPGVARLVKEAMTAGVPIAVCSTSNERAVSAIVRVMLGSEVAKVMQVFAGDMVPKKKPDPAIYLLAAEQLNVDPAKCVVVEDSHIGTEAAKAAGMKCVVTISGYTAEEDFSKADAIFKYIGDEGDEQFSLQDICLDSPMWTQKATA